MNNLIANLTFSQNITSNHSHPETHPPTPRSNSIASTQIYAKHLFLPLAIHSITSPSSMNALAIAGSIRSKTRRPPPSKKHLCNGKPKQRISLVAKLSIYGRMEVENMKKNSNPFYTQLELSMKQLLLTLINPMAS